MVHRGRGVSHPADHGGRALLRHAVLLRLLHSGVRLVESADHLGHRAGHHPDSADSRISAAPLQYAQTDSVRRRHAVAGPDRIRTGEWEPAAVLPVVVRVHGRLYLRRSPAPPGLTDALVPPQPRPGDRALLPRAGPGRRGLAKICRPAADPRVRLAHRFGRDGREYAGAGPAAVAGGARQAGGYGSLPGWRRHPGAGKLGAAACLRPTAAPARVLAARGRQLHEHRRHRLRQPAHEADVPGCRPFGIDRCRHHVLDSHVEPGGPRRHRLD